MDTDLPQFTENPWRSDRPDVSVNAVRAKDRLVDPAHAWVPTVRALTADRRRLVVAVPDIGEHSRHAWPTSVEVATVEMKGELVDFRPRPPGRRSAVDDSCASASLPSRIAAVFPSIMAALDARPARGARPPERSRTALQSLASRRSPTVRSGRNEGSWRNGSWRHSKGPPPRAIDCCSRSRDHEACRSLGTATAGPEG